MDDPYFYHFELELYFIAHDPKFMDHEGKLYGSRSEILLITIRNFMDHDLKFIAHLIAAHRHRSQTQCRYHLN